MADLHYPEDGGVFSPDFENSPLTRPEYFSVMVHFYRGELDRTTSWRMRLDTTTNWAILSVMALVSFSLGDSSHTHLGILVGMVLVMNFLIIESRRYRFFDVWRARTRMLEENFVGPILRRDLKSPIDKWGSLVAEDLLNPSLKISWPQALRARLNRNYIPIFLLLIVCWIIKLGMSIPVGEEANFAALKDQMRIGTWPWWVAPAFVGSLYLFLTGIFLFAKRTTRPEEAYWGTSNYSKALSGHDT